MSHRPIEEIARELFAHPEFVIGNFLTRKHVAEYDYDPDKIDPRVSEYAAEQLVEVMYEYVAQNYSGEEP